MNKFGSFFKPLMWFTALLLSALLAGCGSGGDPPTTPTSPELQAQVNDFDPALGGAPIGTLSSALSALSATPTCGIPSQTSPGNIYPCCENRGNCTWWAWKMAADHWSSPLPNQSFGDAHSWNENAGPYGYLTGAFPQTGAIGVREAMSSNDAGHVAYVTGVNCSARTVTVTEMNCCERDANGKYCGKNSLKEAEAFAGERTKTYSYGFFSSFIFDKTITPPTSDPCAPTPLK